MAFLDVRYRSSTSTTPEYTVPNAAGAVPLQADDIVLGICLYDSQNSTFEDADYPTGFVELAETILTGPDGQQASLAYKRLTGADTGTYTFNGAVRASGALFLSGALSFRGRHTTNPPVVTVNSNTSSNPSTVSMVATGHTNVGGDDDLIIAMADVTVTGAGSVFTPPAGYSSLTAQQSGFLNIYLGLKENVGAGATGDLTSTLTLSSGNAGWIVYHVRLPSDAAAATSVLKQMMAHHGG